MTATAARARGGPAASDTHGPLIRAARATHAPLLTPCPAGVRESHSGRNLIFLSSVRQPQTTKFRKDPQRSIRW
jgi:hypothetical protein